jgi:ABC-2 type transport system permease protein
MNATIAIARREFASYFNSPIAYFVIFLFLLVSGWMFFDNLFLFNQTTLREFFGLAPFLFVFFAPAITMRLIAEERRTGTIEMLFTLPVRDVDVVLGKFLAATGFFWLTILLSLMVPYSVSQIGDLDMGPVVGGYLGLMLLGAAYLAIGLMASAWTKSQMIAFLCGMVICLILNVIDRKVELVPPSVGLVLQGLSPSYHFRNIARGVVDLRDILYFFSLIGGCLLIAVRSLESRQWR